MTKEDKLILIGVISAAHGIQGNVLIKAYTESPDNITKLPVIDKDNNPIQLKKVRITAKNGVVCKLKNCNDRNQAESLKGTKLYCARKDMPITSDDEFYIEDLRGMKVLDTNGQYIGTVLDITNYGAGDIIEIKFADNSAEMFPFTKDFFPTIEKDHVVFNRENFHIE